MQYFAKLEMAEVLYSTFIKNPLDKTTVITVHILNEKDNQQFSNILPQNSKTHFLPNTGPSQKLLYNSNSGFTVPLYSKTKSKHFDNVFMCLYLML